MDCDNTKCTKSAHSRCNHVLLSGCGNIQRIKEPCAEVSHKVGLQHLCNKGSQNKLPVHTMTKSIIKIGNMTKVVTYLSSVSKCSTLFFLQDFHLLASAPRVFSRCFQALLPFNISSCVQLSCVVK
jgi:hypothetical protein